MECILSSLADPYNPSNLPLGLAASSGPDGHLQFAHVNEPVSRRVPSYPGFEDGPLAKQPLALFVRLQKVAKLTVWQRINRPVDYLFN
jgi:hypothetical protein